MSDGTAPRLPRLHITHAELLRADIDRALDVLDMAIRERRPDLMRRALRAFDECQPQFDQLRVVVGEPA